MFLSVLFPPRIRNTVFRENVGNYAAVLLGICFALPFRHAPAADMLTSLSAGIRNIFLYGETYSFPFSLLFACLPTLFLIFFAYTVFGRLCIPAVFFFYSFFRTFVSCAFIRTFGSSGCLYALALYGLSDLILFPGLCVTACLSGQLSSSVARSCRGGGRTDIRSRTPELLCGFAFPLFSAVLSYILIHLVSVFLR